MKEETLSKKEWMLFNEKGFKTKDVAEAVKKLKEVVNLGHYNWSITKTLKEIDKIIGEFDSPQTKSLKDRYAVINRQPNSYTPSVEGAGKDKNKTEDTHSPRKTEKSPSGRVEDTSKGCGDIFLDNLGLSNCCGDVVFDKVVLCPKCQDKKKEQEDEIQITKTI